jgi:hypothetical protein
MAKEKLNTMAVKVEEILRNKVKPATTTMFYTRIS